MNRSEKIKSKICVLLEQKMTISGALEIFNMSVDDLGDLALIKKKYRMLSLKNHPDKGGSTKEQAKINNANDILKITIKTSLNRNARKQEREERMVKQERMAKGVRQDLLNRFKIENFIKHFSKISGEQYTGEIVRVFPEKIDRFSLNVVGFEARFKSPDESKIFSFEIVVFSNSIEGDVLGSSNITYNISIDSKALVDNQNLKIAQRSWSFSNEYAVLFDPEKTFPTAKIKKLILGKKTRQSKVKKRDVALLLSKKYNAKRSGDDAWEIPIGKEGHVFILQRSVFMRLPHYLLLGVFFRKDTTKLGGKVFIQGTISKKISAFISEDSSIISFLSETVKGSKGMDGKKLADFVTKVFIKHQFKSKNESNAIIDKMKKFLGNTNENLK